MEAEKTWRDLVGIFASVWSILQMLSPLPTCYHFMKTKGVGDMIVTPYVVALMSCSLWLFYGFIIEDVTVIRVNLIGAGLQLCYTLCYYSYCLKKEQVRKQVAAGLCVVFVAITYAQFETNLSRLVSFLGFYCSCVTVAFFASPLANMHYVIKVWNSESLPRLLIAATFIVSVQWSLYGYIINDRYILVRMLPVTQSKQRAPKLFESESVMKKIDHESSRNHSLCHSALDGAHHPKRVQPETCFHHLA